MANGGGLGNDTRPASIAAQLADLLGCDDYRAMEAVIRERDLVWLLIQLGTDPVSIVMEVMVGQEGGDVHGDL